MADATADDVLAARALYSVEQGDCEDFLIRLPADSVDLCIFSPPYDLCRTYSIGFNKSSEVWALWMATVIQRALRVCRGPVVCVCQGQTTDYAWTGSPVLLMANLLRAGVTLRRPVIYRRDSIPGSGGEDYLRMSWEFCIVATRGGKLPWADPTACGHPPKWGPGGEMSNRLANGARVNQFGFRILKDGTLHNGGQKASGGVVGRIPQRPSHIETVIGPADDAPCLPGLEAPPPAEKGLVNQWGGTARKQAHGRGVDGEQRRYETPSHVYAKRGGPAGVVLANPGDVISHLYTQAEVDALLAAYQGSDVCDVGAVGGGRMGSKLAHKNEAPFPETLAAFFIRTFCPPGGVVLDCFAGSGTTLAVAVQWGRRAIGCDLRGPEQPDPRHDMVSLTRRRMAGVVPPLPAQTDPAPEPFPLPESAPPAPPEPCLPGLEGLPLPPLPPPIWGSSPGATKNKDGSMGKRGRPSHRRQNKPPPEEPDHAG